MIRETIVTTRRADGTAHIAPLGLIEGRAGWIIAPFYPSGTLDNLRRTPFAVANHTDDVRVFAGCLTGRRDWPCVPAETVPVPRLCDALAHEELEVVAIEEDDMRPRFHCRVVRRVNHAPFAGFNRAQAAVVEGAILVSRLAMLPRDKIDREIDYLRIAVGKTAGPREEEAWCWLMDAVATHYSSRDTSSATATEGAHASVSSGASIPSETSVPKST